MFFSQINFLQSLDSIWTTENLLPVLKWEQGEDRAIAAWSGYLVGGRWNEGLLGLEIMNAYLTAAKSEDVFDAEQLRRVVQHLVGIAVFSVSYPGSQPWLSQFIHDVPPAVSIEWTKMLGFTLMDLDSATIDLLWSSWLGNYLENRVHGRPISLTRTEGSMLAECIPFLASNFEAAVSLIKLSQAPMPEHSQICHRIMKTGVFSDHPTHTAEFLISLLRNTARGTPTDFSLQECAQALRPSIGSLQFSSLLDAATDAGYVGAVNWN
jgi:hypothetical protein